MDDINTIVRNLAYAIVEGDTERADKLFTEAMLHFIEKKVRNKAEEMGYLFEAGVTYTDADGDTSSLLPLNPEAAQAREQINQLVRDDLVENLLAARLAVGASRIPRIPRNPGEKTSDAIGRYFANKQKAAAQAAKPDNAKSKSEPKSNRKRRGFGNFWGSSGGESSGGGAPHAIPTQRTADGGEAILGRMRALAQRVKKARRDGMLKGL